MLNFLNKDQNRRKIKIKYLGSYPFLDYKKKYTGKREQSGTYINIKN